MATPRRPQQHSAGSNIPAVNAKRLIATTEHANVASQAVMRRLGMRLLMNPHPEPSWLQVVGVLDSAR
jgi:hypothetical protein